MYTHFFFNDTATTEIYSLSLHDALPIWTWPPTWARRRSPRAALVWPSPSGAAPASRSTPTTWISTPATASRSEEHTSELQSRLHIVCRLLLEKKKKKI